MIKFTKEEIISAHMNVQLARISSENNLPFSIDDKSLNEVRLIRFRVQSIRSHFLKNGVDISKPYNEWRMEGTSFEAGSVFNAINNVTAYLEIVNEEREKLEKANKEWLSRTISPFILDYIEKNISLEELDSKIKNDIEKALRDRSEQSDNLQRCILCLSKCRAKIPELFEQEVGVSLPLYFLAEDIARCGIIY